MKALLPAIAVLALSTSAFGSVITLNCAPIANLNSFAVGNALSFVNASGTGSFSCSDASLGAVTLNSVTVGIFTDYQFGNGTNLDPNDNSAGFTFTDGGETWAAAHGSPTLPVTTMNLAGGLTVFVTGNASSNTDAFTNTNSGGLSGTPYTLPMLDSQTGSLVGIFSIPVAAFVDFGGFVNGQSTTRIQVTYDYTAVVTSAPEPGTMILLGGGLVMVGLNLKKFSRRK